MTSFNLRILTPEGIVFSGEANSFQTTTEMGRIGIYANMTRLIGLLKPNISIIEISNSKTEYVLVGGIINVDKNDVKVFCDLCLEKNKIKLDDIKKEIISLEQLISKTTKETLKNSYETSIKVKKEILKMLDK